jgi:hypothetical protein
MFDGIYRASVRGDSTFVRRRVDAAAKAKAMVVSGSVQHEAGKSTLLETRDAVRRGWQSVANTLLSQGDRKLAADVIDFVGGLAPPLTAQEHLARDLRETTHESRTQSRVR